MASPYVRTNRDTADPPQRVVVLMSTLEVEAVDGWGVPAGMNSRSETVRALVRKGLKAARDEKPESERSVSA